MDQLPQYAWIGALLFARLGTVMMLAPGWGEAAIPATFRLAAAVLATAALAPGLAASAPAVPQTFAGIVPLVGMEVFTGLVLGGAVRILMSAMQVAGTIIGIASGLGFAQQIDPMVGQQSAIFSAFFSLLGVLLVTSIGLHRVMIEAAAESYLRFPPGAWPPLGDAVSYFVQAVSDAFRLGMQIAAPVLVFSLVFNIAIGLANRLVPQVQMFMILMPIGVLLSIAVTALGFGAGAMVWLEAMDQQARVFAPQ
jgi:flagellar biosynthesis protein FliR